MTKVTVRKRLTANHASLRSQIFRRGSNEQSLTIKELESRERNAGGSFLSFRIAQRQNYRPYAAGIAPREWPWATLPRH